MRHLDYEAPPCALPLALSLSVHSGLLHAEGSTAFKAQHYAEENGRIEVNSLYNLIEGRLGENWIVSAETVYNTISGATPTGLLPEDGSSEVPTEELSDIRRAITLHVSLEVDEWTYSSSLSRSKEDDYSSTGGALNISRSLNKKNTTVGLGYAYTADQIFPFAATYKKKTHDAILSFSQVLNKRTTFGLNLAYSNANGFLNDPYKSIQQVVEIRPGRFSTRIYKGNRPDERERWILYGQLNHRLDEIGATVEASYRYSTDEWDINTHTVDLKLYQDLDHNFP